MRLTLILATSFLVILLSSGIESYRLQKREAEEDDSSFLSKAQGYLQTVNSAISSAADGLMEKVKETGVPDKMKEIYDQGAEKVTIYTNILFDQLYHWTGRD